MLTSNWARSESVLGDIGRLKTDTGDCIIIGTTDVETVIFGSVLPESEVDF